MTETATHRDGLAQLRDYIEYCESHQSFIRESLGIRSFSSPYGILICGREKELKKDRDKQKRKAGFNRDSKAIQVRTYDSFLRILAETVKIPRVDNFAFQTLTEPEVDPKDWAIGTANR